MTPPKQAEALATAILDQAKAEIARLRELLVDPGDPAWEDARAVLAVELRKAEMPNHARAVENGDGAYIPSWMALNLIAHARLVFSARENADDRAPALVEAAVAESDRADPS